MLLVLRVQEFESSGASWCVNRVVKVYTDWNGTPAHGVPYTLNSKP